MKQKHIICEKSECKATQIGTCYISLEYALEIGLFLEMILFSLIMHENAF